MLDFDVPKGLRFHVSSLSSPNFATSYTLSTTGFVDGSLSYLYSSLPLQLPSKSSDIDLRTVVRGYRHLQELRAQDDPSWWEIWQQGRRIDKRDTLLYGRLYLPHSTLEALYLRRLSPTRQLKVSCISDSALANGGTVLASLENDHGKYSTEYLYSTDSGLLGVRGLYNFGPDPREKHAVPTIVADPDSGAEITVVKETEPVVGRFSAGAELYYGLLNKTGGVSTGVRFTTLPRHTGFPYTMTLTLNPLMGNLQSTYAVKAGQNLALSSRFGFNFYSYESDLQLGLELWRMRQAPVLDQETEWARSLLRDEWKTKKGVNEDVAGILKAKVDQNWRVGLLWEGRMKELLFTLGASFDLRRRERVIAGVGLEVQYSS